MNAKNVHFAIGDPIVVNGTLHDGKVGTIIRYAADQQYLVALEDGTEVVLDGDSLSPRH
jgi:hypothetical protein